LVESWRCKRNRPRTGFVRSVTKTKPLFVATVLSVSTTFKHGRVDASLAVPNKRNVSFAQFLASVIVFLLVESSAFVRLFQCG
jgi:hypothetical protein